MTNSEKSELRRQVMLPVVQALKSEKISLEDAALMLTALGEALPIAFMLSTAAADYFASETKQH